MQQRAARTQIRPDPVLESGDDDDVELATDECRRSGHEHRLGASSRSEGVLWQLAREHLVDEPGRRRIGLALHEAGRGREQRDGCIERSVRLFSQDAGAARLGPPLGREAAVVPQGPEHLLDRAAGHRDSAGRCEELGEPCGASAGGGVDGLEASGCRERIDEQLVSGAHAARGEFLVTQREPEPTKPDPVEAAERTGEHVDGELGGELLAVERQGRSGEEGRGRRRVAQCGARASPAVGTSASASPRSNAGTSAPERRTTAIDDHGMPSSR